MSLSDRHQVGLEPSDTVWDVFISYASLDTERVAPLVFALRRRGLKVWWDVDRIDTFDGITSRLEEGIAGARVVLACLSETYPTRAACQHEAFEVLRRLPHDQVSQRLLTTVVTAGALGDVWPVLTDLRAEKRLADDPRRGVPDTNAVAEIIADHLQGLPTTPIGPTPARSVQWWPQPPAVHASFESRTNEMLHLHSMLVGQKNLMDHGRAGPIRPAVVAAGMGGIGKTMLVGQYLLNTADAWPGGVIRIDCGGDRFGHYVCGDDPRLLEYVGEQLADYLYEHGHDVPGARAENAPIQAARSRLRAMRHRLREHHLAQQQLPTEHRSVWWLDDLPSGVTAEDLALICSPIPESAATVITTRDNRYAQNGWSVGLTELNTAEGQAILDHYRDHPRTGYSADEHAIPGIVDALGGHPLALDVVGALRWERGSTWVELWELLDSDALGEYEAELGASAYEQLTADHIASVRLTLTASLQHLAGRSPDAADLVASCSLLQPGATLPAALIADVLGLDDRTMRRATGDAGRFNLLTTDGVTVRVHALVAGALDVNASHSVQEPLSQGLTRVHERIAQTATDPAKIVDCISRYGVQAAELLQNANDPNSLLARIIRSHSHVLADQTDDPAGAAGTLTWAALRYDSRELAEGFRGLARAHTRGHRAVASWTTERTSAALIRTLTGHTHSVYSVAFGKLPDGRTVLATGSRDATARLWEPKTGNQVGPPLTGHHSRVYSVAFGKLPDGRTVLATGSRDATARLWDPTTGQPIGPPMTGHTHWVSSVAFGQLPDGRTVLATGSRDATARLWDPTTGQPIGPPMTGHTHWVSSVAFGQLPDGRTVLATGSHDKTALLWDATTGQPVGPPLVGHQSRVSSVAFDKLSDGRTVLATGSDDKTAQLWDATTGQPVGPPLSGHTNCVSSVAFGRLPDGRAVIGTTSDDDSVRLWDPNTGRPTNPPMTGHTGRVYGVAFGRLSDGRTIVATGSRDETVRLWDPTTAHTVSSSLTGHTHTVSSVAVANLTDGRTVLATGSRDTTVRLWDPTTGQPIGPPLTGHTDTVRSVAFASLTDGRTVLATGSWDETVRLWDPTTGQPIGPPLTGHTGRVYCVAFGQLPDGRTVLATGSEDMSVRLWDPTAGQPISPPLIGHTKTVSSVAFASLNDGRTLMATGSHDETVRLWDPTTGQPISPPLTGHSDWVYCVAFGQLPDGRPVLATGSDDMTVRLWDPTAGQPLGPPLTSHNGRVYTAAFTGLTDGRTVLATGSRDATVRLWDPSTGQPISPPLTGHTNAVRSLTFAELTGGRSILATASGNDIQIFDLI